MPRQRRDLLVIGGDLAGAAAALAGVRSGARTRLLVCGAQAPGDAPPIPEDPTPLAKEAIGASDIPHPEEPQIFRFRARRVRRWLDELDIENDEAWATNLHAAILERCEREGVAVDEVAVPVRLITAEDGSVSGAVLVDGQDCQVHEAATTVLAGGGVRFLWPGPEHASPPVGLAMAHRAQLPVGPARTIAWQADTPARFIDGLRGDGHGHCEVAGVAACGEALATPLHQVPELAHLEDVVRGLEAGGFQGPEPSPGNPELVPMVDDAMPPGFTATKLARMRATLQKLAGHEAEASDVERAHAQMLEMRGEFADYARARPDTEVHLLHEAADVALALVASRLEQIQST